MGKGAGRGKYKGKPTGRRNFSTPDEMAAGSSDRVGWGARRKEAEKEAEESVEESESESEEEEESKAKGTHGLIEVENPNHVASKNIKARDVDLSRPTELSRREREEIEKQRARERYQKLQEEGKTEQARKDLERLSIIRQQRLDAAKKRDEEKAAKEQKKMEGRK